MRKNLIALAATVAIAAGISAQAATLTYSDVNGNWAQADINNLTSMQIMTGFNDNKFHPDAWMTRTEFINATAKSIELPQAKISAVPTFQSVNSNAWSFQTVDDQAMISAYPAGVFRPENPVRRVEVMAALAGSINRPLVSQAEADQILSRYNDADQVPANLRRQVATAIQNDLVEIDPKFGQNELDPLRPATRAEVAAMLNNLYDNREIAIVQNGNIIAASDINAQSGINTQTQMNNTTTVTQQQAAVKTQANDDDNINVTVGGTGYRNVNDLDSQLTAGAIPFRNSADTLQETRNVTMNRVQTGQTQMTSINLPANTTFTGTVAKAIYSEFNRPGDPVMVILDHALFDASGRVVAPAGSRILGHVTSVLPYNEANANAQLGIAFNQIITPSGQRLAINGSVANSDGILRADAMQGIVFHPEHSTAALKREISTAQGGMYGTKLGKMQVLEEPLVTLGSDQPLALTDMNPREIVIGVGDRLQVRIDGTVNMPAQQ